MIKRYELFLEARLGDIAGLKGSDDIITKFRDYQDSEFEFNKKLIKYITLDKRIINDKIRVLVNWYHEASHDLQKRIKDRTTFKSIDEFNNYFKSIVNILLPNKVGRELFSSGRYSIYDKELNISTIIEFNINKWIDSKFEINVITILTGRKGNNVIKILDIE